MPSRDVLRAVMSERGAARFALARPIDRPLRRALLRAADGSAGVDGSVAFRFGFDRSAELIVVSSAAAEVIFRDRADVLEALRLPRAPGLLRGLVVHEGDLFVLSRAPDANPAPDPAPLERVASALGAAVGNIIGTALEAVGGGDAFRAHYAEQFGTCRRCGAPLGGPSPRQVCKGCHTDELLGAGLGGAGSEVEG